MSCPRCSGGLSAFDTVFPACSCDRPVRIDLEAERGPYAASGKEVLLRDVHFADCRDDAAAWFTAGALNHAVRHDLKF